MLLLAGLNTILKLWISHLLAAAVEQGVSVDASIWKEVKLVSLDQRILGLFLARQDWLALSEILQVENHQYAHAGSLEQVHYDIGHLYFEEWPCFPSPAIAIFIADEPSNVR